MTICEGSFGFLCDILAGIWMLVVVVVEILLSWQQICNFTTILMHERQFVAKKWQKWSQSWMLSFKWTLEKFNAHGHDNFGRLQPFFP